MIEGPASPFLEPLVGLQCTLVGTDPGRDSWSWSGPIKKVQYRIIEVTYNAYVGLETAYLVGQTYEGHPHIRRAPLTEIMLTEESQNTLVDRLTNRSRGGRP